MAQSDRPRGSASLGLRPLRSVRVRITLAAALVTAAAMSGAGWLLLRAVEGSQLGDIEQQTEDRLDAVAAQLIAGVPPQDAIESGNPTTGFLQVIDAQGQPWAISSLLVAAGGEVAVAQGLSTGDSAGLPAPSRTETAPPKWPPPGLVLPPSADDHVTGGDQQTGAADGVGPGIFVGVRDPDQVLSGIPLEQVTRTIDTPNGQMTVTAAAPVDQVASSVRAVRQALTVGLPIVIGAVVLAAWWLVGRALRPVELIRAEAEAIGGTTLHRRVPEPATGDEIGRLAGTMNAMLDRLESSARGQRRFVSDASHELRSPVAAIRTDLEVALAEGDRADWPTVGRAVLAEEARLESLLGDLLVLAAEDEGEVTLPGTAVDLSTLAAEEARRSRRVPVTLDVPGNAATALDGLDASRQLDGSNEFDDSSEPSGLSRSDGPNRADELRRSNGVDESRWPDGPGSSNGAGAANGADELRRSNESSGPDGSNGVGGAKGTNGSHEPLVVAGSRTQLQRTLANLVDNAARHARSDVRVGVARAGDRIRVWVDDDGAGIPPRDRERVFERFTRLDEGRARDQGGSGLGLAVVRSIVTRHGGQVWADERPDGAGARFVVELPALTASSHSERGQNGIRATTGAR